MSCIGKTGSSKAAPASAAIATDARLEIIVIPFVLYADTNSDFQLSDFQLLANGTVTDHPIEKFTVMRDQNVELLFAS